MLHEACEYAASLQAQYRTNPPLHMAVNLSARQLARPEIVDEVREILTQTGLDPETLVLEITESVMIQDMELAIGRLTELKGLGVRLAIDDFGTGYSSLTYLRRFPVETLKIDRSFVAGIGRDREDEAIVDMILSLARALVHDPEVLILDEPASGLDPRARVELRGLLAELRSMGKTVVISSHILS